MSDLIRVYGMKCSQNGICRKCGISRDRGGHSQCDRWPTGMMNRGFHYVANSEETTVAELVRLAAAIAEGDENTHVRFELRIRQVDAPPACKRESEAE